MAVFFLEPVERLAELAEIGGGPAVRAAPHDARATALHVTLHDVLDALAAERDLVGVAPVAERRDRRKDEALLVGNLRHGDERGSDRLDRGLFRARACELIVLANGLVVQRGPVDGDLVDVPAEGLVARVISRAERGGGGRAGVPRGLVGECALRAADLAVDRKAHLALLEVGQEHDVVEASGFDAARDRRGAFLCRAHHRGEGQSRQLRVGAVVLVSAQHHDVLGEREVGSGGDPELDGDRARAVQRGGKWGARDQEDARFLFESDAFPDDAGRAGSARAQRRIELAGDIER